jgi:hypothetical protein
MRSTLRKFTPFHLKNVSPVITTREIQRPHKWIDIVDGITGAEGCGAISNRGEGVGIKIAENGESRDGRGGLGRDRKGSRERYP